MMGGADLGAMLQGMSGPDAQVSQGLGAHLHRAKPCRVT